MSAGFTPGPWAIQKPNSDDKRRVIAPMQAGFDVCRFVRSANDAHLIAAAPDMFEALEEMLAAHPPGSWPPRCVKAFRALAKARGEA